MNPNIWHYLIQNVKKTNAIFCSFAHTVKIFSKSNSYVLSAQLNPNAWRKYESAWRQHLIGNMENDGSNLNDHLYLLEVLVDNVSVASNDDPDIAVQVQFGDIGTFLIRRTNANSADPTDVDIADGKCLLFSMRPMQLVKYMEIHPLVLTVVKMSTGNNMLHSQ